MLSFRTQFALALLHDISNKNCCLSNHFNYPESEKAFLLLQFESRHFIRRIADAPAELVSSYCLACDYASITLLDVLETIGEGIYINSPHTDNFYNRYGVAARKLGVINQMVRLYLSEISAIELPLESH